MMTTNDVTKVYGTILSTPGMQEIVKIDLRIPVTHSDICAVLLRY